MPDLFSGTTVRLGILQYVKALYEASTAITPAPTGKKYYGIDFSLVEIGPLSQADGRRRSAIGVNIHEEKKTPLFPLTVAELTFQIEFRYTVNSTDESVGLLSERLLGVVQQIMLDDRTLGGKVILMDEVDSTIDLMTYADRTIEGYVRFTVQYRHANRDVYNPDPTV